MSPFVSFLLILSHLALASIAMAQVRAPHGISFENPMAFSPSAYGFFHPNTETPNTKNPSLPVAAQVDGSKAFASKASSSSSSSSSSDSSGHGLGAGGVAGIVFGLAFAVLLAMGVYYVKNTRRVNAIRANSVQPNA